MVRSKSTFRYGYFVARLKVPRGVGTWPAFWLNSAARASDGKIAWPPEIDIAEIANNGIEDTTSMVHVGFISHGPQAGDIRYVDRNFNGEWSNWRAPANLADDFHLFAALWAPDDTVSVLVDGLIVETAGYKWIYDDGSPAGYAHVILNLAIGGQNGLGATVSTMRPFHRALRSTTCGSTRSRVRKRSAPTRSARTCVRR